MDEPSSSGTLVAAVLLGVGALGIFFLEFVVPSGGLLAVLCVLCALASVALGFMHDPMLGMALLAAYALAAPFLVVLGLRLATQSRLGRRMVLRAADPARTGARIESKETAGPSAGTRGEALTPLRPSGFVRIDGARLDATADGDFIDAGSPVEVAGTRDGQLRVRPARP
jgi:membrane-bound ClpP family serine protease